MAQILGYATPIGRSKMFFIFNFKGFLLQKLISYYRANTNERMKMASKEHDEIVELMRQQINATDRTTHAVRAIVLPSTITLVALLIALPIILLGVFAGEGAALAALFIGGIVLLVGGIMAIASQISETRLSEIPGTYVTEVTPTAPIQSPVPSGDWTRAQKKISDPDSRKCSSCGANIPANRMVCPECGMN